MQCMVTFWYFSKSNNNMSSDHNYDGAVDDGYVVDDNNPSDSDDRK